MGLPNTSGLFTSVMPAMPLVCPVGSKFGLVISQICLYQVLGEGMEEILYLISLNIDYLKSVLKGDQCLILTIRDSCITTTATTSNAITDNIDNTMC